MVRGSWPALLLIPLIACGHSPSGPSPTPTPIVQPDPAQFDAMFNGQFVHNQLDAPGSNPPVSLFHGNPSIYVQSAGLTAETLAAMESEARAVVPIFSGGRLSVADFVTTGADLHPLTAGAIVVEQMPDLAGQNCGLTDVGAAAGHIRLYTHVGCNRPWPDVFGHELGHALGFWHVADPDCLMSVSRPLTHTGQPCDKERYHAGLAYASNGAYMAD